MKPIARLATVSARHVASAALVWVVIVVAGALSLLACSTLALAATTHDEAVFDHLWARARALKPEVLSWLPGDMCCPIVCLPDSTRLACSTPAEFAVAFSRRSTPPDQSFDSMPDAIDVESDFVPLNRDCGNTFNAEVRQLRLIAGTYKAFEERWTGQIARRAHAKELADSLAVAWRAYRTAAAALRAGLYRGNGYIRLDPSEYDMATQTFRVRLRDVPMDAPYKVMAQAFYAPFHGQYTMNEAAPARAALDLATETLVVGARAEIADEVTKHGGGSGEGVRVDFVYRFSDLTRVGEATQWSPGHGVDVKRTLLAPSIEILGFRMQVATPDGPKTAVVTSGLVGLEGLAGKPVKSAGAARVMPADQSQWDLCHLSAISLVDTARTRREVGAWANECAAGHMILMGEDLNIHLWKFTPFPDGFLGDPQVGSYKGSGCSAKLGFEAISDQEIRFNSYGLEGGGCVGISYFTLRRQGAQLVLSVFSDEERTQLSKTVNVIAINTAAVSQDASVNRTSK